MLSSLARTFVAASAALLISSLSASPAAAPAKDVAPKTAAYTQGHVYLFRGLGNFWSRGMDKFKTELDVLNVPTSINNHLSWRTIAADIVADKKAGKSVAPLILVGHSYGADAAVQISDVLSKNGIPVRLLVVFDNRMNLAAVGGNVVELVDYYKPPFGKKVRIGADFKGKLTVNNLVERADINHDKIDKDDAFHREVIAKILELMKAKPAAAGRS